MYSKYPFGEERKRPRQHPIKIIHQKEGSSGTLNGLKVHFYLQSKFCQVEVGSKKSPKT
jgi:hypothetical protein